VHVAVLGCIGIEQGRTPTMGPPSGDIQAIRKQCLYTTRAGGEQTPLVTFHLGWNVVDGDDREDLL